MTETFRLDQITTRAGDQGHTTLADGVSLAKSSLAIWVLGDIDELNSVLGLASASMSDHPELALHQSEVQHIQNDLFDLGAEFAMPGYQKITQPHIAYLDGLIDVHRSTLPPLKEFILPGGCEVAARLHHARTVCRRTERQVVALRQQTIVSDYALQYLNRLSDVLFLLARMCNFKLNHPEIYWKNN